MFVNLQENIYAKETAFEVLKHQHLQMPVHQTHIVGAHKQSLNNRIVSKPHFSNKIFDFYVQQ